MMQAPEINLPGDGLGAHPAVGGGKEVDYGVGNGHVSDCIQERFVTVNVRKNCYICSR